MARGAGRGNDGTRPGPHGVAHRRGSAIRGSAHVVRGAPHHRGCPPSGARAWTQCGAVSGGLTGPGCGSTGDLRVEALEHPPIFRLPGVPDHVTYTWLVMLIFIGVAFIGSPSLPLVPPRNPTTPQSLL